MPKKLSVHFEVRRFAVPIPQKRISTITKNILKKCGVGHGEINLLLVRDAEIHRINRKYLNHDCATDVITFGYIEKSKKNKKNPKILETDLLGEIIISLDTTRRQAKIFGNDFFYELCFYICHGILHILGWNDKTVKQRRLMLAKQAQILKQIGIKNSK